MVHDNYTYLIVGGGMAADAAVHGIREVDPDGTIGLISAEPDPPYKRPPLSKKLWRGKPLDSVWLGTDQLGVDLHLGRTGRLLDLQHKRVVDDRGTEYGFDKLLLATGVTPRRLPVGGHWITYYRTLKDYQRLRQEAARGQRFAVIGGGFIGSEIAAALAMNGKEVVMILPEAGIGSRLFPSDLAGVPQRLLPGARRRGADPFDGHRRGQARRPLHCRDAGHGSLDHARVSRSTGSWPASALSPMSSWPRRPVWQSTTGSWSTRSCAPVTPTSTRRETLPLYWQSVLGQRRRVEHEDNATTMGRLAGRAMAGEPAPYEHLPFFYSDMFDLGYEAVGDVDARLEVVAEWEEPYRTGVLTYRGEGRVRGVLLWNVWDQLDAARALIADPDAIHSRQMTSEMAGVR